MGPVSYPETPSVNPDQWSRPSYVSDCCFESDLIPGFSIHVMFQRHKTWIKVRRMESNGPVDKQYINDDGCFREKPVRFVLQYMNGLRYISCFKKSRISSRFSKIIFNYMCVPISFTYWLEQTDVCQQHNSVQNKLWDIRDP